MITKMLNHLLEINTMASSLAPIEWSTLSLNWTDIYAMSKVISSDDVANCLINNLKN